MKENNIEEDVKNVRQYIDLVLGKGYCDCNELNVISTGKYCDGSKNVAYSMQNILAELEQMKQRYEERDNELWERVKQCNNLQTEIDRIYAEKEELIEINKKQYKQIKELEEELAKYKSLDYMFKIDNKENRVDMKKIYFEWLDSIPKKVVKEVLQNNRNELFGMTCLSKEQYRPYEIQIERINKIGQELLEGEK